MFQVQKEGNDEITTKQLDSCKCILIVNIITIHRWCYNEQQKLKIHVHVPQKTLLHQVGNGVDLGSFSLL